MQLIQSSFSDNDETLNRLDELGFIAEIAKKEHYFFEDITLINAYKIWKGDLMEVWKISVLTGIGLIVLGIILAMLRRDMIVWMAVVIILGIIDIALGLLRKKY